MPTVHPPSSPSPYEPGSGRLHFLALASQDQASVQVGMLGNQTPVISTSVSVVTIRCTVDLVSLMFFSSVPTVHPPSSPSPCEPGSGRLHFLALVSRDQASVQMGMLGNQTPIIIVSSVSVASSLIFLRSSY